MVVHRLKRILKIESVALPGRRRALRPLIQNFGEADRTVKPVKRDEAVTHWEQHQRPIATVFERLRQRVLEPAFHEDLHEHPHIPESLRRDARQQRKLGDPRAAAVGFHAQPVQPTVAGKEKLVESAVVLELGKQTGWHQRLLVNEHDVRRLRRWRALGLARKVGECRSRRGFHQLSTHESAPSLTPR